MRHAFALLLLAACLTLHATSAHACPAGVNPSCPALTCADVLNGYGWADDLAYWSAVCGSAEYVNLLAYAEANCATECGGIPTGDNVYDLITQANYCDPDNCTPDGISAACDACMAGPLLRACVDAGC